MVKDITLVVSNDEMSSLYHIIKKGRRRLNSRQGRLGEDWCQMFSDMYRTQDRYTIVFKDNDSSDLYAFCKAYKDRHDGSDDRSNIIMARDIMKMFNSKSRAEVLQEQKERAAKEEQQRLEAEEAERREQEHRRQVEQERRELQARADQGAAWDTGVTGDVNNGVWNAGSSWDTDDDVPY